MRITIANPPSKVDAPELWAEFICESYDQETGSWYVTFDGPASEQLKKLL